jgi:hypothetical protein
MTIDVERPRTAYFLSFVEPNYSRSATLLNGNSPRLQKHFIGVSSKWRKIFFELLRIRNSILEDSAVVVMSPAQKITPLVRIVLKQKVILDAGWPLTDGVISRGINLKKSPKLLGSYLIDLVSFHSANLVLVESRSQLKRISRYYVIPQSRLRVSYTGVNESAFSNPMLPTQSFTTQKAEIIKSRKKLNVLFRGSINNESGIDTIIGAASVLSDEINLIIIANRGRLPAEIPTNCFIFSHVSEEEMKDLYRLSEVTLGQISKNKRLKFTIPHKAFEAGFFSKVYVTPRAAGVAELYSEKAVVYLEEVSVDALVETLRRLYDGEIRSGYEQRIFHEYSKSASQTVLALRFEKEFEEIRNNKFL